MRRLSVFPVSWAITIVPDPLLPKRRSSRRESLENMNLGRHDESRQSKISATTENVSCWATSDQAPPTATAMMTAATAPATMPPIDRNSRDLKSISRIKSCV